MRYLLPAVVCLLTLAACGESETETKTELLNPGNAIIVNSATATPSALGVGDTALLEISITGLNQITSVVANLAPLGGNSATLVDDGTAGDATADDGVWSAEYTLPTGVAPGVKVLTYQITDSRGLTHNGAINVSVVNLPPVFNVTGSTLENADGVSGNTFGPDEVMELRIDVQDPEGNTAGMTVTADLSTPFGGSSTEPLTYNATSGLWELDYTGPRTLIPTSGSGNVLITATDANSAVTTQLFSLNAENWVGLAGSASAHGISTSAGWTLGSFCVTDAAGRIYVAYSSRVDYPGGWQYAVYVKRYDPATNTWSGLAGSDSGFGLCLNTQGRRISSGYVRDIAYYVETNQAQNKEAVYIVFDGDPDPDDVSGEAHWDSFLYRWNITDNQWEALDTGTDASDYITDTPTVGVMDVGGFTKLGKRAQEASISFDPATDDVYVAWHGQIDSSGSNKYAVFVSRFNRVAGAWQDFSGATPADGISDDHLNDYKYPKIRYYNGNLYVVYVAGSSAGNILIRQGDVATGIWSAPTTIYDATGVPGAGFPDLFIDSAGQMYSGWKVTQTGPTDQEVHVLRATTTTWATPANWTAPDGVSSKISIPGNTATTVIYTRLAGDAAGNVYACWNQVHPGSTSSSSRNVFMAKFDGSVWRPVRGSLSGDGLSDYGTETHWLPAMTLDPQGRAVVCYDTFWGPGSGNARRKIYVKVLR